MIAFSVVLNVSHIEIKNMFIDSKFFFAFKGILLKDILIFNILKETLSKMLFNAIDWVWDCSFRLYLTAFENIILHHRRIALGLFIHFLFASGGKKAIYSQEIFFF